MIRSLHQKVVVMLTDDDLLFIRKFPDKCCATVSRRGVAQPCDLTAVAAAIEVYETSITSVWPVCKKHLRGRELVPLAYLISRT
jgi:hypothetical protein